MADPNEIYDAKFVELVQSLPSVLSDEAATTQVKNLETFSKSRPPTPEPEPIPDPVPTTAWGKFKCGLSNVWDNETTRVLIKAGGAFAGVGLVVWSTVHRDHVVERTALQQANQRNS